MKCFSCENLMEYPIKVVDFNPSSIFSEEIYHFESGWKCTWNGNESLDINELSGENCRCVKEVL